MLICKRDQNCKWKEQEQRLNGYPMGNDLRNIRRKCLCRLYLDVDGVRRQVTGGFCFDGEDYSKKAQNQRE